MKKILASILLVSMSLTASALTLWSGAPVLASPAEIRALMPQVRETSAAQRAADPSALLEIPSTLIAGEPFTATYHFESNQLQRIQLRAQPGTPERIQALLKSLQASLRASYGLPVSPRSRPSVPRGSVDHLWSSRRMSVQLLMVDGQTVNLIYRASLPSRPLGL
jgi:hypothetical protein